MTASMTDIKEDVSLADLTTFGVGGPARYFTRVSNEVEAAAALAFAGDRGLDHLVLGGGSNVLISDEGFPGLVILNRIGGVTAREADGRVLVEAGGGEDWQDFVDLCVARGWQGVECLAGIPGTVGASPIQNIGAYGQEVSGVISRVRCLDTATGKIRIFGNGECAFRYRESIFNTGEPGRYLVLTVTFGLTPGGAPVIGYRELEERLAGIPAPTPADVRDAVIAIRSGKGVLIREGHESFKSAGSFFRNPVVTPARYEYVRSVASEGERPGRWAWPLPGGDVKLSAAWLIQNAGFERGYIRGRAGISPRHTLILVNGGGASAREIVALAGEVRQRVFERFGVLLQPEARLVGFGSSPFDGSH